MLFSEHRARLCFTHLRPGYYDVVLEGDKPLPNLTTAAISSKRFPALPKQVIADLDKAWGAEVTTVPTARIETARRSIRLAMQVPSGAGSQPTPAPLVPNDEEGDDDGESGDCHDCDTHLDRKTPGVMCNDISCQRMRCRTCHPSRRNWWCPDHLRAGAKRRRPPAPAD